MTIDRRKQKGEKTRQAILLAAENIMKSGGKDPMSTRSIAKKAGISQSSLYHHYDNVEAIIFSCLMKKARETMKPEHLKNHINLSSYLEFIIKESILNFQAMQTLSSGHDNLKKKIISNQKLYSELVDFGKEIIQELKNNVKSFFNKEINEERLEIFIFGFYMFRDGVLGHSQAYHDASPFRDIKKKTTEVIQIFYNYLLQPD